MITDPTTVAPTRLPTEDQPPSPCAPTTATLSVIVPVFNEEATVAQVIRRVLELDLGVEIDLIAVDDASTDGTGALLAAMPDPRLRVVSHTRNRGKGAAISTGIALAEGEVIVIQDADLEYDPAEWGHLLQPILTGEVDVVYGSRFLGRPQGMRWCNLAANKFLTAMTRVLYGTTITDMETCYKLIRAELVKDMVLEAQRFDIEPEITARLLRRGVEIRELPISYVARSHDDGKKIGVRDGLQAIATLLEWRVRRTT